MANKTITLDPGDILTVTCNPCPPVITPPPVVEPPIVIPPPTTGGAPEPSPTSKIIHQDNFDRPTSSIKQGYASNSNSMIAVPGRSGNAIRFPYAPGNADMLIEKGFPECQDIYFRYWFRISKGWLPYGGRTGSGMKWFMPWRSGSAPRYTCGVGQLIQPHWQFSVHDNSSTKQPNPFGQNKTLTPKFDNVNDGEWHKYTLHIRTINPSVDQIWIDDILVLDDSGLGFDHSPAGIAMFQFPGLVVDGIPDVAHAGNIDIDDFVVWTNP